MQITLSATDPNSADAIGNFPTGRNLLLKREADATEAWKYLREKLADD